MFLFLFRVTHKKTKSLSVDSLAALLHKINIWGGGGIGLFLAENHFISQYISTDGKQKREQISQLTFEIEHEECQPIDQYA